MKKANIVTTKEIGIFINEEKCIIRVQNSVKCKKYFHRLFGNDPKIIELALEIGLKEGHNSMTLNDFFVLCDKLDKRNRLKRTIKFCLKTYESYNKIKWKELSKHKRLFIHNQKSKVQIKKAFKEPKKIK